MKSFSYPFPSPLFLSLFLSLSLFFMISIHGFSITSQNIIQDACKTCAGGDPNIEFYFCTTSLQAAPGSQSTTTLHGLGKISIKLISHNVTNTTSFIKNMLKNKTLDPYIKECLGDCLEMYNDAISYTKEAMNCYNLSRYIDANTQISSIMDAAETCQDGFSGKTGLVSPLTVRNNNTFELSAMSLALMRMLQT